MKRRNFFYFLLVSLFGGKSVYEAFKNNTQELDPKIIEPPIMTGPGLFEFYEINENYREPKDGEWINVHGMKMRYCKLLDSIKL